jgi:hypothetical protein
MTARWWVGSCPAICLRLACSRKPEEVERV